MLPSPSVSVTAPDGGNQPAPSSRRRGLSYLRGLSQNRPSGSDSPEQPRSSPRSYFSRSTSYTSPRNGEPSFHVTRRRSASRVNERSSSVAEESGTRPTTGTTSSARDLSPTPVSHTPSRQDTELGSSTAAAQEALSPEPMARSRPRRVNQRDTQSTTSLGVENGTEAAATTATSARNMSGTEGDNVEAEETKHPLPTIRFFPHQEVRPGRQSLNFAPVARTLPNESSIIRVGRYSEREGIPTTNPTTPSDAPVGFKSKVVSRKHCEFSFADGHWQIRDVASSSGTFLNHIRLSQPNMESRQFPVKDGDIVQLGIDFRGGEEMIFRCVKIRIECNRSWQKRPNNFNKIRHAQLQSLAKDQPTADDNRGECAICLGAVVPCQALFIAPCAHAWHYKCIRPMLEGRNSTYPQFQCPNCRAYTDLSADVEMAEEDMEEWKDNTASMDHTGTPNEDAVGADGNNPPEETRDRTHEPDANPSALTNGAEVLSLSSDAGEEETAPEPNPSPVASGLLARRQASQGTSPEVRSINGIDMPGRSEHMIDQLSNDLTRTETVRSEDAAPGEGPLTPRNNAGPFVFDGSAGRDTGRRLATADAT